MTSRSYLYENANSADALQAAFRSGADTIVCDLEDSVPTAAKADARENLVSTLDEIDPDASQVGVRINGMDTDYWLDDMATAIEAGASSMIVPMVTDPSELLVAAETITRLTDRPPEILFQLENPIGLFTGREIALQAKELPPVTAVTLGLGDYTKAIGADSLPDPVVNTLGLFIASIASIGDLTPVATVHRDVDDLVGLEEKAEYYRSLGFQGQSALDERQVPVINAAYAA